MLGMSPAWGGGPEHWLHSIYPLLGLWLTVNAPPLFFFYTGFPYVAQAGLELTNIHKVLGA